ncbi:Arm DNA-binding domain-containing protein [Variovorax sp. LjRoot175]|uniref:hypothetical protein n=1 Tax=Variovorax sp. LjRoot175 TaxID=3342276 RepID=UPI003ED0308F
MLTDTFMRQVKHKGAAIGERYADGGGMYLRVRPECPVTMARNGRSRCAGIPIQVMMRCPRSV